MASKKESFREQHRDRLAVAFRGVVAQGIFQASFRNIRLLDDCLRAPHCLVVGQGLFEFPHPTLEFDCKLDPPGSGFHSINAATAERFGNNRCICSRVLCPECSFGSFRIRS